MIQFQMKMRHEIFNNTKEKSPYVALNDIGLNRLIFNFIKNHQVSLILSLKEIH